MKHVSKSRNLTIFKPFALIFISLDNENFFNFPNIKFFCVVM